MRMRGPGAPTSALAERYETPLPKLNSEVDELTSNVESHLKQMNFKW